MHWTTTIQFPVRLCILGAVGSFWATVWLRKFKVRPQPSSRTSLSMEERQRKIRTGSWIPFGLGCLYVVGAIIFVALR
jgi:hypothetical protein